MKSRPKPIPRFRTRPRLGTWPQNFNDPRSHVVQRTGQIILRGVDKTNFRFCIFRRAGGHCEIEWDGKVCGKFAAWDGIGKGDLVHIVATGRGGSDTHDNCLWGCQECHRRKFHPGLQWSKKESAA